MKFSCHKCGQKYEYDQKDQGRRIQCQCGEAIDIPKENPRLFECPDCSRMISKSAVFCPGCGTPINAPRKENSVLVKGIDLPLWDAMKLMFVFFLSGIIWIIIIACLFGGSLAGLARMLR